MEPLGRVECNARDLDLAQLFKRFQQDPRLARMLHGGAAGLGSRLVSILVNAVMLPLTVRYLGKLEYGVWVTVSTSVMMFGLLDLGIANTLTNFISEAFAEDDREKAQAYFATAFWLTIAVVLVLGSALGLAWRAINWGGLLHLTDPVHITHARLCIAIAIAFFLIGLPLNLVNRAISGYQQVHVTNYFAALNSVLGMAAIFAAMLLHGNIVGLMVAYCASMLVGSLLLNIWFCGFSKPWIRPYPGKVSREKARSLFGQGSLFFVLQLTSLVVFNSDNLVITHYLGAAEVTPYSVAWRLIGYATMLQTVLIPSFWPAFTEAYRKREMAWVRRVYNTTVVRTTALVAMMAVLMGFFGRSAIRWWAGEAAMPTQALLWAMAGWAVMSTMTTNQALLLTATGRLKLEAIVAVIAAVVNLSLSIVLVQRIGSVGVILSTVASFAICMAVPQELEVRRVLRGVFLPGEAVPLADVQSLNEVV
jgi:O-antigen/teichoic acid export membrane protein